MNYKWTVTLEMNLTDTDYEIGYKRFPNDDETAVRIIIDALDSKYFYNLTDEIREQVFKDYVAWKKEKYGD